MRKKPKLRFHRSAIAVLGVAGAVFALIEVNLALLHPMAALAAFAMPMVAIVFLQQPLLERWRHLRWLRWVDVGLAAAAMGCFAYVAVEAEALTYRATAYTTTDVIVGVVALLLILEATRRATGPALPILAVLFAVYAFVGPQLPRWMLPHQGESVDGFVAATWLDASSNGVFGLALSVMFRYVFPFVLFGAFLEVTGATQFIVTFANRVVGHSPGGPAKIAVIGSGLMGSLSGSAVANTVTSGTFTIPLMKSSGFKAEESAGIEAAASAGGALLPPVMGAGAYMMLEILGEQLTLIEILRAALIPGLLYYLSIFLYVHFHARRVHARKPGAPQAADQPVPIYEGVVFAAALGVLVALLLIMSPFRAVTYSIGLLLPALICHPRVEAPWRQRAALPAIGLGLVPMAYFALRAAPHVLPPAVTDAVKPPLPTWSNAAVLAICLTPLAALLLPAWRKLFADALIRASQTAATLVAAVCCVGIVIAVITITGAGTALPSAIIPIAEKSLLAALLLIMVCSIILGMGLPSAVCYLLLAILIGDLLASLDVPVLAAHLFVFYFGMMSMVTPPVALAGYAAASIAGAGIMRSSLAAFRFALVGFTLPYMFVYRPQLLLMLAEGEGALAVVYAIGIAVVGILSLAVALSGYLFAVLTPLQRALSFTAAALALFPDPGLTLPTVRNAMVDTVGFAPTLLDLLGVALLLAVVALNRRTGRAGGKPGPDAAGVN